MEIVKSAAMAAMGFYQDEDLDAEHVLRQSLEWHLRFTGESAASRDPRSRQQHAAWLKEERLVLLTMADTRSSLTRRESYRRYRGLHACVSE